ncbi:DUF3311 domain-containing protein [Streptomyces daliensis]|uniref:DUF3311 domain-containing protein n=1 Tax=Streptomyces daliensis TaxID=299421 RepID=A0A8T4IVM2_9ACTN|nr:DUF3311 domain-containing protein [Streptomyces daliensis]
MSAPPQRSGPGPVVTPTRVVAGLCLFAPFVAILWVGSYARVEPTLIGIPFFYWYQMLWVLIACALTIVAYGLARREQRARRTHAHAVAPEGGEAR